MDDNKNKQENKEENKSDNKHENLFTLDKLPSDLFDSNKQNKGDNLSEKKSDLICSETNSINAKLDEHDAQANKDELDNDSELFADFEKTKSEFRKNNQNYQEFDN